MTVTATEPLMLDIRAVAAMLGCSPRHVWKLATTEQMPRPVKLGTSTRWSRAELLTWIGEGCPPCADEQAGGAA